MKIGIYCYFIADILTELLQQCSLIYHFSPNLAIWLVDIASERLKLWKIIKKGKPLKSCKGDKTEFFIEMFITLVSTKLLLFIVIPQVLLLLWQLKFSTDL